MIQQAPGDDRFAPDCFAGELGRRVPVRVRGEAVGDGVLVDAVVAPDGRSVEFTLDIEV